MAALTAVAQERSTPPYGSTLTFGTGLVNIPVAWVSPGSGDLFVAISARSIGAGSFAPKANGSLWDLTESLEAHVGGRVSLGASLYGSKNQQVGAFAKLLVLRQPGEGSAWRPSVAVGVRNLGASAFQDRFATGDRRVTDALPNGGAGSGKGRIGGSPTLYGVATREFTFDRNFASLSVGWGNGLFKNAGGLDTVYNKRGTLASGLFIGGRAVLPTGRASALSLMLENDGWDYNFGALLTFGHLSVGLFLTELEEAKGVPDNKPLANFTKTGLMFSYNASIPDIIRGGRERAEATEAQVESRRLQQEIAQRRTRAAEMQRSLAKATQGADKSAAAQAAALSRELDAERDAMRKAADRLDQLQKGARTPGGTP